MPELMGSFFGLESYYLTLLGRGVMSQPIRPFRACMPMNEVFFQGTKKSRGILEGESPRQLKFQRPV